MNADLYFTRVYAHAARAIRTVLEGEPPGLVLSIDVGGSFFDCIALDIAGAMGHRFVQAPSLARYRSRIFDYRMPLKPADIVDEPVLFGRVDGWMHVSDDAGAAKAYCPGGPAVATRSVDRWMIGREPLRLVHFGDTAGQMDHVAGAAETIQRDRPVLTFYPPSGPERSQLLSQMENCNYRVLNIGGDTIDVQRAKRALDFGWIAVPAEKQAAAAAGTAELNGGDADVDSAMFSKHELARHAVARQFRSSAVFGLNEVGPPELRRSVPAEDAIVGNDCYPVESDGDLTWRWLGPRPRSRIAVSCPFPGTWRFEVAVLSCRTPEGIGGCRVLVEGQQVSTSCQGSDKGTIAFIGHLAPSGYRGYAEIDFVNAGFPPPAGADPRVLRMNVSSIQVAPCT